ncbi:glycosyl hydrolase [Pseudoalteromonas phenolica]|uniref:Glycosyl hydrolase n=2 Tax=Pseudoalteromonas phenolica TaxID=161398 RepID=A0A4Q7IN72_9GAMM|nr:glycosyl hydrolase [Pseudoalteromonas phenolica]
MRVEITTQPYSVSYFKGKQLLVKEEQGFYSGTVIEQHDSQTQTHNVHGVRFNLNDSEQLLGTGERVLGMDRRGHRLPLYNRAHYGYETESVQMNYSLPAVMSNKQYMLLFDNSAKGWVDLAKSEQNVLQFEAVAGRNAYIVVAGDSYPELIANYTDISGTQPILPRWAFGNFASRFGYRTQQEVMDTVAKFKALNIPLDSIIIDLYWFGRDIQGHMGNLAWDKDAFPEPEKMLRELRKQGIQPILITEPFILSSSKRWDDAVAQKVLAKDAEGNPKMFDFYFGNTGIVDVFNDTGRNWFNNIYQELAEQGVQGWWGDLGEPEVHLSDALHTLDNGQQVSADAIHNAYGHQWAKMLFQHLQTTQPEQRPFILMRAGAAGSQRYGMVPWTGDVNRTWGGLKPQVELSLQMGMFGLGYTHSDLGGFAGGEQFNKELYIRWLQYGVFQPIYRPHGQEHIPSEVVFHDKETQDILRQFIELRYQMMPYNYTLAYQNSQSGLPLMRPTFIDDTANTDLSNKDSYLWGDAFFVHPITSASLSSVDVTLPKGVWFNYFSGKKYEGGKTYKVEVNLKQIPVFVKAGAFVPMVEKFQTTQNYSYEHLTLHYWADKQVQNATGSMYEDDGHTMNADKLGEFELLNFAAKQNNSQLGMLLMRQGKGYKSMPKARKITLKIHNWQQQPKQVKVGDQINQSYDWNNKNSTLTVKFNWQHQPLTLQVQ